LSKVKRLLPSVVMTMALVCLAPSVAHAQQPSLADRESARSLMDEGDKKRDSQDMKGALKAYEQADAIMKVPTTGLEVARTQVALGQLLEARETLARVLRLPSKSNEPAPFVAARKAADQMNNDLAARIPAIQINLQNQEPGQSPTITVDNEPIPAAAASAPRKVNPGAHTVMVKLGTYEKKQEVTLVERDTKQVTFDLKEKPPEAVKPVVTQEPDKTTHVSATPKVMMYGGFALGAVGIGVGAVTGIMSLTKTNDLKPECKPNCPPDKQDEIDSAQLLGNISTVAFIVGGVGVAVGIIGVVMSGSDKKEPPASAALARKPSKSFEWHPVLSPTYAGLTGSF